MLKIGCHLSSSEGFLKMGKTAVDIGANTFQFFARNPRGARAKPLDRKDIADYISFADENGLFPPLAHAPYTLNPCSADSEIRKFTLETMADDLSRIELIPGCMYNFHPGSHVKQGADKGIALICELLDRLLTPELKTTVLLETMAGKGSEIGRCFEEIGEIIDRVQLPEKVGVCLDTCHVHDAGYDIVSELPKVLKDFDKIIGIDKLKAVHLNDSMNALGSRKDRHAKIGKGCLSMTAFENIINHPSLRSLPFYLETPNELSGYAAEIAALKSLYKNS